jgi:hypothetical protein
MGYNIIQSKTENRKPKTENRQAVFGLSREWLTHDGKVIPSLIVLSHDEQLARLSAACPEAAPAAVVAGDVVFDRLLASRPLRESYRDSLGVRPHQRLVVVSSTWGPHSLLGAHPDLVRALALHCPVDEYRIALAAHPNVWHGHSPWQVREWLAAAERAGVILLPVADGWKGALVAADLVVGDYGSVTYYGAALATPVLLASAPENVVAPDSPTARLLTLASRIDDSASLPDQLTAAVANHDPHKYGELTALTTSQPGRAAELLRRTIYGALDLPEPPEDAPVSAVPVLPNLAGGPRACLVAVTWSGDEARVVRYPAERLRDREPTPRTAHLAVSTDEPRRRWLELADVLINDRPATDPAHWIGETLSALPGCLLAATRSADGPWHVGTVDHTVTLSTTAGARCASAVHGWLTAGHTLADLPPSFTIQPGDHQVTVH